MDSGIGVAVAGAGAIVGSTVGVGSSLPHARAIAIMAAARTAIVGLNIGLAYCLMQRTLPALHFGKTITIACTLSIRRSGGGRAEQPVPCAAKVVGCDEAKGLPCGGKVVSEQAEHAGQPQVAG